MSALQQSRRLGGLNLRLVEVTSSMLAQPPRPQRPHSRWRRFGQIKERCKIHDVVLEGIGLALKKRGYPAAEELKAGKRR